MKKSLILSILLIAIGIGTVNAQELPDRRETMRAIVKVNDYFMKKWPDAGLATFVGNKMRPSSLWTRAVYYEGLMALYTINPQDRYFKYMYVGQASASGDYRETGSDRLIAKLRDKAAKCGANAIIITEHQVIADDSGQISTSPKFSGGPERVDTGNSWNAISEDSDLNFANSKRHTPVTTSGSVNNFTRIIRAEFIRY